MIIYIEEVIGVLLVIKNNKVLHKQVIDIDYKEDIISELQEKGIIDTEFKEITI